MPAATQTRPDGADTALSEHPNIIDMGVFEQILEMDDDPEDREFSREIVVGFFEQAENTLTDMKRQLESRELHQLSALGHFLKGSSATLGLVKVQKSCEKIQNYGNRTDATGEKAEPDDAKSLQNIRTTLGDVETEYEEAKDLLERFFKLGSYA